MDVFADRWKSLIPQKFRARKTAASGSEGEKKEKGGGEGQVGSGSAKSGASTKEENVIAWRYNSQQIKLKDLDNFVSGDIPKLDLSKSEDLQGKDGRPD